MTARQGCFDSNIDLDTNKEIKTAIYKDVDSINRIEKMFNDFMSSKKVNQVLSDPDEAFYSLVQSEFNMPLDLLVFQENISKGQIDGLQSRLNELQKSIKNGTLSGKMAELFYTPSTFAKKDPVIGDLMNNFLATSHNYEGAEATNINRQTLILKELGSEMATRGYMSNSLSNIGKRITKKTAMQKVAKLEYEIDRLAVKIKNGNSDAEAEHARLTEEYTRLWDNTDAAVYAEMINHIEGENGLTKLINDKLIEAKAKNSNLKWNIKEPRPKDFLTKKDISKLKDPDGNPISGNMINALYEYTKHTERLYFRLRKGVNYYIDSVIEGQSGKTQEALENMRSSLEEKLMPNLEKGFYPHFRRGLNVDFMDGLMGRMEDLALSANKYLDTNMSLQEAIDNIEGYVSGHTRNRAYDLSPEDYSWNFPQVLKTYSANVNRFNYINKINLDSKRALKRAEDLYKKGELMEGYGESIVNFVKDLHKSATGFDQIKNPVASNLMRSILGLEFITKIGFNPRSAARNFSQSLLNFVEWGPVQMKESRDFYNSTTQIKNINQIMEDTGILFKVGQGAAELKESMGGRTPGIMTSIRINPETGAPEHIPITRLEKVTGSISNLAGKSGFMTAAVENVNRKMTFKIAYMQMYKSLNNPQYAKYLGDNLSEAQVESKRQKAARDYAVNMTVGLHFDYNAFSKAKALRTPAGQILGQFQHYSFKFFEKNMDYYKKGKNEIMRGELGGDDAWKLYRLGMAYFMAPALASAITGVDFENLIEHDPSSKIKNLYTAFAGTEEEKAKATYGKGPVLGSIGAPFVGDLLNIGMMTGLINTDPESLAMLISGFDESYAKETRNQFKKDKLYSITQLLNSFGNRLMFRHIPALREGNIGWVAQSELGLYPNKEAKKKQKAFQDMTPELQALIDELQQGGR